VNIHDHIDLFLTDFIRPDARDRYRSILQLNERRWGKITFHDFASNRIEAPTHTYLSGIRPTLPPPSHSPAVKSFWDDPDFVSLRPFADLDVDIFSTGHTKITGHKQAFLRDALTDYALIFDGFIAVLPSSLYVLLDHDDNLTICKKSNAKAEQAVGGSRR